MNEAVKYFLSEYRGISAIPTTCLIDGYKADHVSQMPKNTNYIYSNVTPRKSRVFNQGKLVDKIIWGGYTYMLKEYLIFRWNETFFKQPKNYAVMLYKGVMDKYLGVDAVPVEHIAKLHDLGYLPIRIKSLPEGTLVPIGTPVMTFKNTVDGFGWVQQFLETQMSNTLWKPSTSATTAYLFRKRFEEHAAKTGYNKFGIKYQGHDFSARGMSGNEDSLISGLAHDMMFYGSDTVGSMLLSAMIYGASMELDAEPIIQSVPATEHAVMCLNGKEDELETFRRIIQDLYPSNFVSIVSDTWDFWQVITEYAVKLKSVIESRNGRVVFRPDSGDPVKIICGDPESNIPHIRKGAYQCLYEIFGGTVNEKGFIELNPCVGLIYGDAITLERQDEILTRLENKGFSGSNLVLGIGSFTYEYVTRDTYGFAMKATWGVVDGEEIEVYKDPITDRGFKKSAKGLIMVYRDENGDIKFKDQATHAEEESGLLEVVFEDGKLTKNPTLTEIRSLVDSYFV